MVRYNPLLYNKGALEEDSMITGSYLIINIENGMALLENQRIERYYEINLRYIPSDAQVGDYLELHDNNRMIINKRKRSVRDDFLALIGEEE